MLSSNVVLHHALQERKADSKFYHCSICMCRIIEVIMIMHHEYDHESRFCCSKQMYFVQCINTRLIKTCLNLWFRKMHPTFPSFWVCLIAKWKSKRFSKGIRIDFLLEIRFTKWEYKITIYFDKHTTYFGTLPSK